MASKLFWGSEDWFENEANRSRIAWIEMYGMPLQAWNTENFNSIAEVWGTVILLDEHSILGDSYSWVNAVIDTTCLQPVNDVVQFGLNGTIYEVFVREISMVENQRLDKKQGAMLEDRILNFEDKARLRDKTMRCSEEVIKETRLMLFGDPIEGSLHDTGGINHFQGDMEN
ncbi:hypothetical protein PIB30_044954 [Stylosanthes scabra]|uniref:DUF4283 domain-containing protein n=1 Tax=Stylosanthes scabra TaxID=79078 RepID=A0ABU6SFV5_9FABA|nr:hypothetical protein [Stylosanthes scabra]